MAGNQERRSGLGVCALSINGACVRASSPTPATLKGCSVSSLNTSGTVQAHRVTVIHSHCEKVKGEGGGGKNSNIIIIDMGYMPVV